MPIRVTVEADDLLIKERITDFLGSQAEIRLVTRHPGIVGLVDAFTVDVALFVARGFTPSTARALRQLADDLDCPVVVLFDVIDWRTDLRRYSRVVAILAQRTSTGADLMAAVRAAANGSAVDRAGIGLPARQVQGLELDHGRRRLARWRLSRRLVRGARRIA